MYLPFLLKIVTVFCSGIKKHIIFLTKKTLKKTNKNIKIGTLVPEIIAY